MCLRLSVGIGLYVHARKSEVAIESIAVLPFPEQKHRARYRVSFRWLGGIADLSLVAVAEFEGQSQRAPYSRYKNKEIDPIKVGNQLGVNAVLSGRIVQRGENLTISAELVDVRHNKLLWGEQYERKMSELLQTQREIAREIVEKLRLKVSGEEKALS